MERRATPIPTGAREPLDAGLLRRLSVAIEQGPLIVCVTDANGIIEYVNPRFTVVTGHTSASSRGQSCRILKSGETPSAEYERLWQTISSGSTWRGEFHNRRADGALYWEQAAIWPLRGETGRITHYVKTAEDITDRKKAERALRESEENLRRVFEYSTDPILLLDESILIDCNQATVEILGLASKADIVGKHPWALSPAYQPDGRRSDEKAGDMIATARDKGTHHFEWDHAKADGSMLPVDITLTAINHRGRGVLHVTWRDASARKAAEAERERLQAQLLQAQKMEAVGRLAGGVAHDFNNMLGVIIGHTEMALAQIDELSPLHKDLSDVRAAAQRSADLTRQLLGFARRQTARPKVLDLNDAVDRTRTLLCRLIGEDIEVQWLPGADLWPVRMDPTQVDQVVTNLAVNARDAIGGAGRVTIETANVVLDPSHCAARPGFAPGDYVMLRVSDNGAGIPRDVLQHVFEPFFTTKDVGKGTGLGLATVYGIVKQNDGLIDVESEPGHGTTFRMYLPRFQGEFADSSPEPAAGMPDRGSETILIVEDEGAILSLAKTILERQGYRVIAARTPAAAVALLDGDAPEIQLLITDVVMPGMNGRDLADRLRQVRPGLKCLFMSGYTADVIARRGVIEDELLFVQKPFSVRTLAHKVREALDG